MLISLMLYSLIKMLYSMCQKSQRLPTWRQLEHAIKRNFGGLETEKLNPFKEFERLITIDREQDLSNVPVEVMIQWQNFTLLVPTYVRMYILNTYFS